jgi:fungal nitric oxide reductase
MATTTSSLASHPSLTISPTDSIQTAPPKFPFARPANVQPAVEYAKLRATEPVSQVELWDGSKPFLVVKHRDITQVLTDDRLSKQRQRPGFPEMGPGGKEAAKNKPTVQYGFMLRLDHV